MVPTSVPKRSRVSSHEKKSKKKKKTDNSDTKKSTGSKRPGQSESEASDGFQSIAGDSNMSFDGSETALDGVLSLDEPNATTSTTPQNPKVPNMSRNQNYNITSAALNLFFPNSYINIFV